MAMFLKIVSGILVVIVVAVVGGLTAARFNDGPMGIVAGGPFTSGELHTGAEPDWSFAQDILEVEFQLLDPDRSRTTWIVKVEDKVYIPSGYMTTTWGKIWKQWPIEAEENGNIILRIGDTLYERNLVRIKDGPLVGPIVAEISRKYAGGNAFPEDVVSSGYLWLFELAPRS